VRLVVLTRAAWPRSSPGSRDPGSRDFDQLTREEHFLALGERIQRQQQRSSRIVDYQGRLGSGQF
jgi:hypothetical protein